MNIESSCVRSESLITYLSALKSWHLGNDFLEIDSAAATFPCAGELGRLRNHADIHLARSLPAWRTSPIALIGLPGLRRSTKKVKRTLKPLQSLTQAALRRLRCAAVMLKRKGFMSLAWIAYQKKLRL